MSSSAANKETEQESEGVLCYLSGNINQVESKQGKMSQVAARSNSSLGIRI
jgi:hypothetical protein